MTKKESTITIVSIFIIMLSFIIYNIYINQVSIAAVAAKYITNNNSLSTNDFVTTYNIMKNSILFDLCFFSIVQLVSYILYVSKKKKALIIIGIIELLLTISAVVALVLNHMVNEIVYSLPIINIILYIIELNEKKSNIIKK